ncbi:hypothetical protein M9194_04630 [Vibrio sp. S4M6]|uniref:hypothetical protein n=1 Tax=Vibrio sinus TaxID=2946865 RepID=UPI00202A203C|nr:hypothetical protein [Vibrio sinus]MCL9780722.1 hypothetical protein [Vibrio sinus]
MPGNHTRYHKKCNQIKTELLTNGNYGPQEIRNLNTALRTLKEEIKSSLKNRSSIIFRTLSELTLRQREKFVTELIVAMPESIGNSLHTFLPAEITSKYDALTLKRVCEHDRESRHYLNSTCNALISFLLVTPQLRKIYDLVRFLKNIFKSIHDSILPPYIKYEILKEIKPELKNYISELSYYEPMKNLTEMNRNIIQINQTQFGKIVSSNQYDVSEIILLSYGLISGSLPGEIRSNILNNYYFLEYPNAWDYMSGHDLIDHNLFDRALEVDAGNSNNTRRYFETKLSLYYLGRSMQLDLIRAVLSVYTDMDINNVSDAEAAILIWSDSEANERILRLRKVRKYKKSSPLLAKKDRKFRSGIMSKRDLSKKPKWESSQQIHSGNGGLMKSTAPGFYDEVSHKGMINQHSDTYTHSYREDAYPCGSQRDLLRPFNASISGHMFFVVALLERFMATKRNNCQLEVNEFLLAVIAIYGKYGFHSHFEVIDALYEMRDTFKEYGVELHLRFSDDDLHLAAIDACDYVKHCRLKRSMLSELQQATPKIQPTTNIRSNMSAMGINAYYKIPRGIHFSSLDTRKNNVYMSILDSTLAFHFVNNYLNSKDPLLFDYLTVHFRHVCHHINIGPDKYLSLISKFKHTRVNVFEFIEKIILTKPMKDGFKQLVKSIDSTEPEARRRSLFQDRGRNEHFVSRVVMGKDKHAGISEPQYTPSYLQNVFTKNILHARQFYSPNNDSQTPNIIHDFGACFIAGVSGTMEIQSNGFDTLLEHCVSNPSQRASFEHGKGLIVLLIGCCLVVAGHHSMYEVLYPMIATGCFYGREPQSMHSYPYYLHMIQDIFSQDLIARYSDLDDNVIFNALQHRMTRRRAPAVIQ